LIYFGWPIAREDDPERAIRAALAIVELVRLLVARLLAEEGSPSELTTSNLTTNNLFVDNLSVR
jgi:hypothetical protein